MKNHPIASFQNIDHFNGSGSAMIRFIWCFYGFWEWKENVIYGAKVKLDVDNFKFDILSMQNPLSQNISQCWKYYRWIWEILFPISNTFGPRWFWDFIGMNLRDSTTKLLARKQSLCSPFSHWFRLNREFQWKSQQSPCKLFDEL